MVPPAHAFNLVVTRQGPNQGRYFYNCARQGGERCSSFAWADDQPAAPADPAPATTVTTVTTTRSGAGSGGRGGGGGASTTITTTTTTTTSGGGAGGRSGGARVAAPGARNGRGGSGPVCKGHQEPCRRQITKKEVRLTAILCGRRSPEQFSSGKSLLATSRTCAQIHLSIREML